MENSAHCSLLPASLPAHSVNATAVLGEPPDVVNKKLEAIASSLANLVIDISNQILNCAKA